MNFLFLSILVILKISFNICGKLALTTRTTQSNTNQFMFGNSRVQGDTIFVDNVRQEFKNPIVYINNTFNLNLTNVNATFANNSTIGFKNLRMHLSNLTGGQNETFYFNTLNITNSTLILGNYSVIDGQEVYIANSNITYGKDFNKTLWRGSWTAINSTVNGVKFRIGKANYTLYNEKQRDNNKNN